MIEHITPADGNVFADLGFRPAEAETMLISSRLALAIEQIIDDRGLKPAAAAKLFGVSRDQLVQLKRGKAGASTIDALVTMLAHAGFRVDVSIRPMSADERAAARALDVPGEAGAERVPA
jgi:predicted XRE-type DNA-binding protein